MFFASRLRISQGLLILGAAGSLLACHKKAPEKPKTVVIKKSPAELKKLADSANEGLEGLKPLLATQTEKFRALHTQFDGLPRDMPDFEPIREKFASADEGLGRMNAKIPWLKGRLDEAVKAGDGAELEEIQQSILSSYKEVPEVNQIAMELMHEVTPFTRMAEQFEAGKRSLCDSDKVGPEAVSKRLP
ncbi:MAG TPA: hypothetical protein VFK05_09030 [Polyangiaceae bacterium]|nr:hypothetical protein [Polyangiaceae bacterium]